MDGEALQTLQAHHDEERFANNRYTDMEQNKDIFEDELGITMWDASKMLIAARNFLKHCNLAPMRREETKRDIPFVLDSIDRVSID